MKKILIASPTSKTKSYCDKQWIENTLNINYPNFEIVLFDNTMDNGEYADSLNSYYKEKYGDNGKFKCLRTNTEGLENSLISRICASHNDCRQYMLDKGFDYLFHLESDVMPKKNVLQELILDNKPVVGGIYYRDEGRFRRLMVQQRIFRAPNNVFSKNFDPHDDLNFVDGSLKSVSHIGLGCILIRKDVLKKIKFRFVEGIKIFPDSFFSEDCFKNKIRVWANTALVAEHRNQNWEVDVLSKNNKA